MQRAQKNRLPKINYHYWSVQQNWTDLFLKKDGQKTNEKMLTIHGHKGNANQNNTKIPPHSCYNGYQQEQHQQQMLVRLQGKRNPHTLMVGM
jgi:hypothetical protein